MLYQLSYASPLKPRKVITPAIQLQATLLREQEHCQAPGSAASYYLTLLRCRGRLGKHCVVHRHVMMNFGDLDDKSAHIAGLADREGQLDPVRFAIIL